jgi:hypothetical protein
VRLALILTLVGLAAVGAPTATAIKRVPCGDKRARTELVTSTSRVWSVSGDGYGVRRLYACMRGEQPRLLGDTPGETLGPGVAGITGFALSRRYVAYSREDSNANYGDARFTIKVRDLRNGVITFGAVRGGGDEAARLEALVVNARGHTAFQYAHEPLYGSTTARSRGRAIERDFRCGQWVDDGPAVDRGLRLTSEGTVRWTRGGIAYRAPICPKPPG